MVEISDGQKEEFERSGFLVLRDAVPDQIIEAAESEVRKGLSVPTDDVEAMLEAENEANVWDVVSETEPFARICGGVRNYSEELIGTELENLSTPMQIAVRYPNGRLEDDYPDAQEQLGGHLDGYNAQYRETGTVQGMTLIATVYLNDVYPRSGGFTVWPGSHYQATDYFQSNALDSIDGNFPQVEGSPFEITGPAGTVILWHNKLVHCGGVNFGNDARMAGFMRFALPEIDEIKRDAATNPWKYWPNF